MRRSHICVDRQQNGDALRPCIVEDDEEVMHLVEQLRDGVIKAHSVMKGISDWCGSDRKKWGILRDLVRDNYEFTY